MTQGSVQEFRQNWQRPETKYCHFTRGEPVNQIQFAFRQNWLEFAKIMTPLLPWDNKRCLEVGAGRGTMSMYFADAGFNCTLLDACEEPLNQAKAAFTEHGLSARYVLGDATALPLADESFDVVFSYGLLEHFEDVAKPIAEQCRVLKSGGVFLAYVVPSTPFSYARYGDAIARHQGKEPPFRSAKPVQDYWRTLEKISGRASCCLFVYPLPMLSASGAFPFTLNSPETELALVSEFQKTVAANGWYGTEDCSQGFILLGWKK